MIDVTGNIPVSVKKRFRPLGIGIRSDVASYVIHAFLSMGLLSGFTITLVVAGLNLLLLVFGGGFIGEHGTTMLQRLEE
jgi:hypothetical protein